MTKLPFPGEDIDEFIKTNGYDKADREIFLKMQNDLHQCYEFRMIVENDL